MVLPISMLKSLHMKTSQKVGLAIVFALVLVIVAMDILRTVYTLAMDLTEGQDANALWGILEPTMAVIVCALPCYHGFINVRTGITRNESFVPSGHVSNWSRLFKSSVLVSASTRSDEKEGVVIRHSFKDGSLSIPSHV